MSLGLIAAFALICIMVCDIYEHMDKMQNKNKEDK